MVKVKIHLRRTEAAQAKYGAGVVIGKFLGSIPLFRVMDGEELRKVVDTGEIKGGDYAVAAERHFGASWGANKQEVAKWGDSQRGGRLGHELFMAEMDGKGKRFFHLTMAETALKDMPKAPPYEPGSPESYMHEADIPTSECSTGLGCSMMVGTKDVKAWYRVGEGGKLTKATFSQLQETAPETGLKPRKMDLWLGASVRPPPKIRKFMAGELARQRLGRVRDRREREKMRYELFRNGYPKEPSGWQRLLFKKACAGGDCSTWYTAHTKAEKEATSGSNDGETQFAVVFRAKAEVAAPHHEAKMVLDYDLVRITVQDPESGFWETIWGGMMSDPVKIGPGDYPYGYVYGSMLHRTPTQRVAARFLVEGSTYRAEDLGPALADALEVHQHLRRWVDKFPRVLAKAEVESTGIPDGWVWQNQLLSYWDQYEPFRKQLEATDEVIDAISLAHPQLEATANVARDATFDPPRRARLDYAFSLVGFYPHPTTGRDHIAYDVRRLKAWGDAFGSWVVRSIRTLKAQKRAADRDIVRQAAKHPV